MSRSAITVISVFGVVSALIELVGKAKSAGVKMADWPYCTSMLCTCGRLPTEPAIAT